MWGLSRRDVIAATLATVTAGLAARAQEPRNAAVYFVPGGRIGFQRPAAIKPLASSWHLLSSDHTFHVDVTEAPRIDPDWDDRMWQPDGDVLVSAGILSPGIEHRHFRSTRYGRSADYREDSHVFRDDRWIGRIKVSTSTLGSPLLANGQIARWRDVNDALRASFTVRPSPTVSEALAELRVQLTVEGLNPRLVGNQLHLSLVPPKTPLEASGIRGSYLYVRPLSQLPLGTPDEVEQATTMAFAANREIPGNRVIAGSHCRGVVMPENRSGNSGDQAFATTVMAFGRTRRLQLTAFYGVGNRSQMLQTLERVFSSLSLPDSAAAKE